MSYDKLPLGLTAGSDFCLYKLEPDKNGKIQKVPYRVSGARADPGNVAHLTDYTTAYDTYLQGGYDGVGKSVMEDIFVVDIDHCVENGEINDFAKEILEQLGTYAEVSPSGTGIHIWGRAPNVAFDKARYYMNNRQIGLEVYIGSITTRFVTITGNSLNDFDVADCSDALQKVLDTYMVRPAANEPPVEAPGSYLSDESVMAKMFSAKNADTVKNLWNGEISEEKSHSEADMSLCMNLAFWCGGDTEQMDRLFRQSALMRDKWDERHGADTYGNLTIQNAIRHCREFYKPMGISLAEADFNDIATLLLDLNPESNRRYRNGDLGSGRLFADVFKGIARFVPERKMWYIYDGIRWVPDIGSLKAMELCKDLADALTLYATAIADEGVRTAFLEVCKKWQQRRYRETFLKEAQSVYPIYMKCFDRDIYLFNCKNGTLDLESGVFREHRAEDLITKVSMVDFVPDATSERFVRFVDEITSGDKEKAIYLQKTLGYGISGDTRYECMFFLYGETTRNGKGTLMESVLSVMGDYGRAVRPETIALKSNNNSSSPTEDIARLAGIRFANISEPSRGLFLNAAQVKNMTGNDTLNARFLHENSFDFKPQFKLYVNTNYLPVINDMTIFSSNRVHIIPFDRHFEEWEQDKSLKAEFATDGARSAILNWLVEGFRLLQKEGFQTPKSVLDATEAYAHDSDKIAQFAEDKLIEDAASEVRTAFVYEQYKSWCTENGCYAENSRNFNHELRKFGRVERKRPRVGGEKTTMLIGYRLKDVITEFL